MRVPLLQRWLVLASLWSALLAVCLGAAYLLRSLPPADLHAPDLWVTAIILLLAGVSFRRLYSRLLMLFDRLIFKDSYDYRAALRQLSSDLSLAGDLDTLAASLPESLRQLMNLHFAALLVYEQTVASVRGLAPSSDFALLCALTEQARPLESKLFFATVRDGDHPALFIPLLLGETGVGCLCLGPKINGEPFRAADRDLLTTLSGQLAALVRNAQLAADLQLKVRTLDVLNDRLERTREEERARLAADLHDEPLQTAMYLDRQLRGMDGRPGTAHSPTVLTRRLADQLRDISMAMQPPALNDLGLGAALEGLAIDMSERGRIPITLHAGSAVMPGVLPSDIDLVLYRAAQEAINNALRHAAPTTIRVSLRQDACVVQLEVTDDGTGFTPPHQLDRLVLEGHLGLASLRQRVERAGGQLTVISAPGRGTTIRVVTP